MAHAAAGHATHRARGSARTPDWLRKLAKTGYSAKGIVYVLIGILAVQAALGGGAPAGSEGALRAMELQPFGRVLLGLTGGGLVAYALWRILAAVFDPEDDGAARRALHFVVGLIYGGLAIEAIRMALSSGGGGGGSGDAGASHWTAQVLSMPLGAVLVAAGGAAVGAYGLYQLYKAWTVEFQKELDLASLRHGPRRAAIATGRFGLAARGVVFVIVAWFLVRAALQSDPSEARGLAGALRTLQGETYGPILLGVTAVGLFAYGLYQFVKARYKRIGAG